MKEEKVIMYESPEAATYLTNIEGWVDVNRYFFGKGEQGERMARYSSHTHKLCECGKTMKKGYLRCSDCRHKSDIEKYKAMPFREWDGKEPVCTRDANDYFFSIEELINFMLNNEEEPIHEIDLIICSPIGYCEIDLETIAQDVHDDWQPESELVDKINEFNKFIQTLPPHSWQAGSIRTNYKIQEEKL